MRIAIFGATSQIAKDMILALANDPAYKLTLFARRADAIDQWRKVVSLSPTHVTQEFTAFGKSQEFDAIINFVGSGNPAHTASMGTSIFDITYQFDQLALDYLHYHSDCRYIFLSSGAAYGLNFEQSVDANSTAVVALNNLQPQDWYAVAKLHAECRHRALSPLPIVDIRVFNYFSHTQDLSARFFIADIVRAIQSGETLMTTSENIVRDYIGPDDFFKLISLILESPATNNVFDCYTKAPVDKMTLLSKMKEYFGLSYAIQKEPVGINATGFKLNYFSQNFRASTLGYVPSLNSLETIYKESEKIIKIGRFYCPN